MNGLAFTGATLVAAEISPAWRCHPLSTKARQRRARGLPSLIAACGFRVEHVESVRAVALIADAALVAARTSAGPLEGRARRRTAAVRPQRDDHPSISCPAQ